MHGEVDGPDFRRKPEDEQHRGHGHHGADAQQRDPECRHAVLVKRLSGPLLRWIKPLNSRAVVVAQK